MPNKGDGEMSEQLRVGFVGLGDIGAPMGEWVVKGGWPLTVFARRSEVNDHFAALGASVAPNLPALGASSDLLLVCVVTDDQVREVLLGDDGALAGMEPGGVVAIHSTILPRTCDEIAAAAATRQVSVLDAPVIGGPADARAGKLNMLVGGDEGSFDRCRAVFEKCSGLLRLVGPLGSGEKLKLFNSYMNTHAWFVALETKRILNELQIDLDTAAEFVGKSLASSGVLGRLIASNWELAGGLEGHSKGETFYLELREKDVSYFRAVAGDEAIDLMQLEPGIGLSLAMHAASTKHD
jgi:3-hydroxyisobutyrate dehydrogenase